MAMLFTEAFFWVTINEITAQVDRDSYLKLIEIHTICSSL